MIGNFSFEEHDRYFTRMYNHLTFIDRSLDITTIINIIKCKVILEQEQENIMHNLNIKNISDTPMIKDFKIWSAKYEEESEAQSSEVQSEEESEEESEVQSEAQSEDESEAQSEDESEAQSEDESEVQSQSEDESEVQSEDESEVQSEAQSSEEESEVQSEDESEGQSEAQSEAQNSEDENDYNGVDEFRRHYRNSETQRYNYIPNISNIPDDY